ncbi:MAG: hypothetical protein COV36_02950 [Alphaproteobacteria bacterium CG11_big_fil_rev_8_21_14_0_20_44_7]|nr:MAG: hypothetical protein COV36_02950 [Alphaproteobacteria bacterium CG11_big_fil_rev_8_21_14_0_20_44_7]
MAFFVAIAGVPQAHAEVSVSQYIAKKRAQAASLKNYSNLRAEHYAAKISNGEPIVTRIKPSRSVMSASELEGLETAAGNEEPDKEVEKAEKPAGPKELNIRVR